MGIKELTGKKPKTFSRYQDLLALKDVDAVMICTPDHGHSPILIAACDAEKGMVSSAHEAYTVPPQAVFVK